MRKKLNKLNKNINIKNYVNLNQKSLLDSLEISNFGLSENEVIAQREKFGLNNLIEHKTNLFSSFLKSFFSPFNLILILIDSFSFYTYFSEGKNPFDLFGALLILIMILLSGSIYFVQEIKSSIVTKKIKYENKQKTKVIRNTDYEIKNITTQNSIKLIKEYKSITNDNLVVGDLIYLSNGDLLPADIKLIWSNNLYLNQSSLTGESFPVQKDINNSKEEYLEFENICYMGTEVVSGSALGIVLAIGQSTYFSKINDKVTEKRPINSFEKGIKKITLLLISFMLAMTPIVFLIFGLRPGMIDTRWLSAALFSISIAVGLTPEMLPIIVTANLSKGYKKIKKENVLVKNLNAVQNMGAIDILCTDKTGTITSGEINLSKVFDINNHSNEFVKKIIFLNSYFQSGFSNPIDDAVIKSHLFKKDEISNYKKEWEFPFDFQRKILSVILLNENQKEIFTKGAVHAILKICNRIFVNNEIVELTESYKKKIIEKSNEFNNNGFRVIAIAHNLLDEKNIEDNLVFHGFATFFDEPKTTSKKIIKQLSEKGIATKILTGDDEIITRSICKKVDFKITKLYTGKQIEEMDEKQLSKAVIESNVFVKLSPIHKSLIIKTLKKQNHVVGFMGDGINDAPVLRESDVAISFKDASNIAQEAADLILLEDSLLPISIAVHQGRVCLANILKYIKITIASNFGNVLSVLIALFLTLAEPMQPLHLLTQNLLYDIVMFAFIFDKVDKKFTNKPRPLKTKNIIWFSVINGPVSSIFDVATFLILLYAFRSQIGLEPGIGSNVVISKDAIAKFNASWFLLGLMTQTAVMQMYRTEKIPYLKSNASLSVNIATLFVCTMAIIIPFTPINKVLGMQSPPIEFLGVAVSLVVAYMFLAQIVKMGYIKIFKEWL